MSNWNKHAICFRLQQEQKHALLVTMLLNTIRAGTATTIHMVITTTTVVAEVLGRRL